MAAMRGARLAVGSAAWVAEEKASTLQIAQGEIEEFSYSARNEVEWLNEHMAEIFSENQIHVTEIFKTPGKLRGRTPRTARKAGSGQPRQPLSDLFSATPKGAPNPFAIPDLNSRRTPKIEVAEDKPQQPQPDKQPSKAQPKTQPTSPPKRTHPRDITTDSGYHGSQSEEDLRNSERRPQDGGGGTRTGVVEKEEVTTSKMPADLTVQGTPTQAPIEETFQSAKEEQTRQVTDETTRLKAALSEPAMPPAGTNGPAPAGTAVTSASPNRTSPRRPSPQKSPHIPPAAAVSPPKQSQELPADDQSPMDLDADEARLSSDGSSPVRPIVRKSSLNFASLPAREPLTSKKSLGPGMARTSQADTRPSYYNRQTGGKSLGNARLPPTDDDRDELNDELNEDDEGGMQRQAEMDMRIAAHNKTYTQRLQDQISMLGKSQAAATRPSKSIPNAADGQLLPSAPQPEAAQAPQVSNAPKPLNRTEQLRPGAPPGTVFDEADDWIAPPPVAGKTNAQSSPRPAFAKSYSTDVMDGVHSKAVAAGPVQPLPKSRPNLPKGQVAVPERTSSTLGLQANASAPVLPTVDSNATAGVKIPVKGISVSNPPLTSVLEDDGATTPTKSPSRTFRESPLKQVKNKLSSILKSSKVLLASSAAISAEGKSSLLSPSSTKLGLHQNSSTASIPQLDSKPIDIAYPDLSQRVATDAETDSWARSPTQSSPRRARASIEREKRELKEREKEAKEARRLAEQMGKLEKAREKEREKARVFSKEKEKTAELERQLAAPKEQERLAQQSTVSVASQQTPQATRTSPRRKPVAETKSMHASAPSQDLDEDTLMPDAAALMPPPSVPRPATAMSTRTQPLKRPLKPSKEQAARVKQAPTVIRVNTTSSQHSQFHPSSSVLAPTLQDSFAGPAHQLSSKSSKTSLQTKPSLQSLKSSAASAGRPKALELAAKRKEQEEREAQRKRDAKLEIERKRAVQLEEERKQEQKRRLEAERENEQPAVTAESKKAAAQRQAAIEKAKQTMAPPPAVRSQPHGPPDYGAKHESSAAGPITASASGIHRSQEDVSRPVNAVLSNTGKPVQKRPLPQDAREDAVRPPQARSGPSQQTKEAKRMRMSDEDEDDVVMETQPTMKGPPVRPSAAFKKQDQPMKPMPPAGYAPAQGVSRDLFKSTLTAQHNGHAKAAHPMDMAQVSKSAIPFAPNPNPAAQPHKTPARQVAAAAAKSAGKSAAKSSPRYQNGDAIELPEIQTDDEDEEDDAHMGVAAWADSPDLRKALMRQETIDPEQIFGPPGPLNMEEVFSKNKDRWHKFRARTSSANWSGSDRLTEEDIRKDLAARDKLRREGGWSYELSRDLA